MIGTCKLLTVWLSFGFFGVTSASAQNDTSTALENLLYVPQTFAAPRELADQSTYAYVFENVYTDSGFVCLPALGYWVDLQLPYSSPCQCNGTNLERRSALMTYDGVVDANGEATGETYFWDPRYLLGGGCVDPENVTNVPDDWVIVHITNPDYPGWYDDDVPLPYIDEPIYSTITSGNSPDVVDFYGKLPWQSNYMNYQDHCAVALSDATFVTPSFSYGTYRFCADFITGGSSSGGKCDTSDCVFFTPYVKNGYICVNH